MYKYNHVTITCCHIFLITNGLIFLLILCYSQVNQLEGQLQREERKIIRIRNDGSGGRTEIDLLHKQIEKVKNKNFAHTCCTGNSFK